MNRRTHPDVERNLALAIIASSAAPALLLDEDLAVIAASTSFYQAFELDPDDVAGRQLARIGEGEWNMPQLRSLLDATLSDHATIEAYEMDLQQGKARRRLILNAQKLDYGSGEASRLLLTISDVTEARIGEKIKDDLLREKASCSRSSSTASPTACRSSPACSCRARGACSPEETRGHLARCASPGDVDRHAATAACRLAAGRRSAARLLHAALLEPGRIDDPES